MAGKTVRTQRGGIRARVFKNQHIAHNGVFQNDVSGHSIHAGAQIAADGDYFSGRGQAEGFGNICTCLLYTSDAADEL